MEQIPHIAIFCQENRPSIPFAFSKYLLPIVVRYLADQNNLVSVHVFKHASFVSISVTCTCMELLGSGSLGNEFNPRLFKKKFFNELQNAGFHHYISK